MKKIKTNFFLLIMIMFFLTLSSCHQIKQYDKQDQETFINILYEAINDEEGNYAYFDLRSKEEYEEGHIRQFQNYDFINGNSETFKSYLETNYGKKTTIFIITNLIDIDLKIFDNYSKVYIYNGLYKTMNEKSNELFIIDKGPYDCGC